LRVANLFVLVTIVGVLMAFTPANNSTPNATAGDYDLVNTIPMEATFLTTDFLKSAYVITSNNEVMKYDSTGNIIGKYSDNRYGSLTTIDAKSPFNVLMFYKEFATVVAVDMKLSARHLYKLSSININNVAAVCLSDDNYIWVYDLDDGKLKKINTKYEIIHESLSLPQLLGQEIVPNFMTEEEGMIYMNVPDVGVMMFDVFGNFYNALSPTDLGNNDLGSFQVLQRKIINFEDGQLTFQDAFSSENSRIPLPKSQNAVDVKVQKGRLFMLQPNELQFFVQAN